MLVKTYHDFYDMFPKSLINKIPRISKRVPLSKLSEEVLDYKGILFIRNPWEALGIYRQSDRELQKNCNTCPNRNRKLAQERDYNELGDVANAETFYC